MYVYAQIGISLPHHAASQYGYGVPVSYDQLQPGDLVFFSGLGHMGMYIGGGQFIHAPHTGDVVKISSLAGYELVGAVASIARRIRSRGSSERAAAAMSPVSRSPRSPAPVVRAPRRASVDLGLEVLDHRAAPELERRRDLAILHREVAREDREALHLLEARALAVRVVDDALHELVHALVVGERRTSPSMPCSAAHRPISSGSSVISAAT